MALLRIIFSQGFSPFPGERCMYEVGKREEGPSTGIFLKIFSDKNIPANILV